MFPLYPFPLSLSFQKLRSSGLLLAGLGGALAISPVCHAQITPDQTLGNAASQVRSGVVVQGGLADLITGGAAQGSNLFHSFSEFNVNPGQRVYFANPEGIGAILSRVTGTDPSQILGTLGVDGGADLFLLNPQGIMFGPDARLDLSGSFQASTAESWIFEDGQEFSAVNPQAAPLLTIQPTPEVMYNVEFSGDITNEGRLEVAAGETLSLAGANVTNRGYLAAPAGTLQVVGHEIYLLDGSHLSVSADLGGGTIRVGGDYQGQGDLPRSRQTWVGENTLMEANALQVGDGGEIILWSDEATYFAGMIEAMGGSQGGDGGFVETSSRGILSIPAGAAVDVSSPLGLGGRWLLDPRDITIVASGGTQASVPELNALNTNTDGSINAAVIETALASGDVTLTASRDITVASAITATPTANVTFTLQADHSIILNSGVGITGNGANTLSVVLNADRDATGGGAIVLNSGSSITSNGGNITLGGGTDPATTAAIGTAANTAGITLSGVTLNAGAGAISIQGQGFSNAATAGADGGVGIALSGTNAITAAAVTLTGTGGAGSDGDNTTRPGGAGGTGLVWDGTNTVTGALSLTGTGGVGGQGDAPANNETGGIGGAGGAGLDLKTTVDPTAALILTGTGGTGGAGGGSTGGMNRTGGDGGAGGSGVVLANGITVGGTNQTIAATLGTGGAEGSGTTTPGTAGANGSQVGLLGSATLDATSLSLETGISATYTLTGSQQGTISGGGVSAPSGTLNFQAVSSVQGHTGTADTVIGTASADSFDISASNTISVAEVTFTGVENLNLIVNNIFVQRGDSDTQQLTIAGVGSSSLGVVYDSINNDYYFSEQFLENYSLGSYTLTANNKFEIVSLYDALLVNASFPKFSAGNEFVMDATHSIDAPGDFSIDVGSGIISGSILPATVLSNPSGLTVETFLDPISPTPVSLVVGNITSQGGNIQLASLGNLTLLGDLSTDTVDKSIQLGSAGDTTVQGSLTTNIGNISVRALGQISLSPTGTESAVTTGGGDLILESWDIGASALNLGTDVDTSRSLLNDVGGNITVIAHNGDLNVTSALASLNNGDGFSTIWLESLTGNLNATGATISAANPKPDADLTVDPTNYAGDILLNADQTINLTETSISTAGREGRIYIGVSDLGGDETPDSDPVPNLIQINKSTLATGNSVTGGSAASGEVQVSGSVIAMTDSTIDAGTTGTGAAGTITITSTVADSLGTVELSLSNTIIQGTTTGTGSAGQIELTSAGDLQLQDSSRVSSSTSQSTGSSGSINLTGKNIEVLGGSVVQATSEGQGAPGSIAASFTEAMTVSGMSSFGQVSELSTFSGPNADLSVSQGSITINSDQSVQGNLTLEDRGRLNALTQSTDPNYQGGSVSVYVSDLALQTGGQILATASGIAAAGDILVQASNVTIDGQSDSLQTEFGSPVRRLSEFLDGFGDFATTFNGIELETITLSSRSGSLSASNLATALAIQTIPNSPTSDSSPTEGSGVRFKTTTGDTLGATWEFISNDYLPYEDFAFSAVGTNTPNILASVNDLASSRSGPVTLGGESIVFGVVDAQDRGFDSTLRLRNISLNGSPISAVNPQSDIDLSKPFISGIFAQAQGVGGAGSITVTAPTVQLSNQGTISATTVSGELIVPADIRVNVTQLDVLSGGTINSSTDSGTAGAVTIASSDTVSVSGTNSAIVSAADLGGTAGDIDITAPTLTVSAGGRIGVDAKDNGTELGTAGSITISGATAITINSGTIGATTEAGSGGLIEILNATPNATTVDILSGGAINSSTVSGTAGDIRVTADGSVTVAGAGSTIESKTGSGGTAGSVTITSDRLNLASTGSVSVGATGTGTAGSILVSAPAIDLDNGVIEAVTAAGGESSPGNITLQNIRTFTATNNSLVSASTDTGLAGSVTIGSATSAATTVDLTDSTIEAKATGARGNAGAVTLYTADLTSNASNIQSSNISGTNATGNVLIEEIQTLTATNGTNISASTDTGLAGNVTIGASGSAATTIDLTGSTIEAKATGAGGNAGAVTLYTADLTSNASNIQSSNISGTNATGNVLIEEIQTLTATNNSNISASTETGLAGSVTIGASGSAATTIDLTDSTIEAKATGAGGNAGAVTVYTNALTANTSTLQASNESGSAGSGNVVLGRLNTLALVNSSLLASTQTGTAGSVLINNGEAAIPRVSLTGASLISVEADTDDNPATGTGTGQAGQIVVNTNQLSLLGDSTGRAVISAATEGGDSQGIRLDNLNRLEIIQGELTASTVGGNAANLQISGPGGTALDQVYLNDGKITVAATGSGTAGQLSINTVDLTAENQSAVSASTNTGQGQSILLQGLNNISLTNSNISASTIDGVAGSITVNQSETPIQTANLNQGSLSVAATGTGSSGDILLNALNLLAQNRSEISASTNSGTGGGVNLTNIKTLELQNSNILAATQTGTAGSISINKDAVAVPIVRILGASRISVEADTDGNATTGVGNGTAGQITINANELFLRGNSRAQITASTENGSSQGIAFQNLDRLTVIQGDITATTVGGSAADLVIGNDNGSTVVPLSQITLNDGNLSVEATGSGTAGQLVILAETLNATNGSLISAATNSGSGQGITLSGLQTLSITNSSITASTVDGSAGNILVNSQTATAPTIALNQGNINVAATGLGSSGSINLNASTLTLQNDSAISASTNLGVGGSVLLPNLLNLSVENSQIQATTTAGEAGSVVVNAANGVQVQGVLRNGQAAGLSVEATAAGRAGNLTVTTPELRVSDGAVLSVAAGGSAQGGNLSITPWGSGRDLVVTLNGGTISGSTQGSGVGGSLSFQATDTLLLRGQGRIAAESSGSGTAGSVNLNALYVTIADGIELSTSTTSSGRGGDVTVTAGNRFLLNNAQISTNAAGVGNGGDIRILVETPANNLVLDNIVLNRGLISAESQRSQGGSISFRSANSLILYNSSLISTGAGELGNGGDINLFAKFVIGMPRSDRDLGNNDVVANAIFGNGGRINLTAEGLFGFLVRSVDNPRLGSRNNITASSRFGTTGIVSISTNVDPSQGLTALAVDLLDPSSLIDRRCSLRSSASQSQFTLAGRGGLAPAPGSGVELSSTGDDLRLSLSGNGETQGIAALSQGLGTVKLSAWGGSMGTDADPNGGLRRSALAQGVGVPRLGDCQ